MLEDTFLEEDIWEYKSKRKPKSVRPSSSENIPKSVEKATDGKYPSKRNKNKKRTVVAKEKAKDPEICLGETDNEISVVSSQGSSCGDGTQQSQDKETTPGKRRKTQRNQASPKIRPVYDGHCPNCQMPFSSLLGQTPRWHVFECLDSPPVSETECPDGLLCTSTIPSHYKKYTHLLLAQSRASHSPFSSPAHRPAGSFAETDSVFPCDPEGGWSLYQKQTKNVSVSTDAWLVTQRLRKSQSPAETNKKISSSTNSQTSPQVPQFTEFVNNGKLVVGLPLAEELGSQNSSEHMNLSLPENDLSNGEISYSPLQSDEELFDGEELTEAQQDLFFTESSKDGSLGDDNSFTLVKRHGLSDQKENGPQVNSLTQDEYSEKMYRCSPLNDSSPVRFRNESSSFSDDPASPNGEFLLFPPALVERPISNYPAANTEVDQPELLSSKQKQVVEESAVYDQISLPLFKSEMSKPFESQGEGCLSFHPTPSKIGKLPSKNISTKNNANTKCLYRKALDGMLDSTVSKTQKFSSVPAAAKPLKTPPSCPTSNAAHPSAKAMKQMDIGVYFGLPPKKKEEKMLGESALEAMNSNPNQTKTRQCKRKAEKSLSDLEFDAQNLNESQLSVGLSSPRSQHQRKRHKKSDSLQEGAYQKRSGRLTNTESEAVTLSRDIPACRRLPRGNMKIPEPYNMSEIRKRTCPFYKKIPGTGFTVDAFQYGLVEGCTAYFLTHFHSDHYAGLSKHFTLPIYCSEITGNLLKSKLHVQEQYIHPLPMDTACTVNGINVVLLDANHCPGAVMILFYLPNGNVILHTGDFRADPSMERSFLAGQKVHTLYLDTTYCSPEYSFPSQQEVIQFAINTAFEAVTLNPRALVVCGTYSIGKEKVFLAIADVLGSKVGMSQEKYKTLQCLNIPEIKSLITTDMCSSLVHLLPMMQITFKGLQSHLEKCGRKYDQILAFRPTGWTHSNKFTSVSDIIPQTKGNISIYGIPYSEHSSYKEMKRFVQWLKPQKIIPTVNVGTSASRRTMEKYFKEWKLEAGY
ncbi:PREDICTED: DNA cross-link repair 1A protein [Condylura cristata]|uniref:DNA cross-link repair 1A protein n=1 Tax=Condylura cristata TaxID=143302 RepID=UPI0003347162|nr:PREDICTED: DNA cross-link repair 1A protein [Condylura cristata]